MNTQTQTVTGGANVDEQIAVCHPPSNRVHPIELRAPVKKRCRCCCRDGWRDRCRDRCRDGCPFSTDFNGDTNSCKVATFIFCLILIMGYFAMMVTGAATFGRCTGNVIETYMVLEGIACMLLVLMFTCWLCNRCIGVELIVALCVVCLTIIVLGAVIGAILLRSVPCDPLPKYAAIGFSCPIWLVLLGVCLYWLYTNFILIDIGGETHCFGDPRGQCCPCCDCTAGAVRLIYCLDV